MASDNNIKSVVLQDAQTKEEVYLSALTKFKLAGWENFQDSLYTEANRLVVADNTAVKVEFTQPVEFPNFNQQPTIGNRNYPIWDFDNQRIQSYTENNECVGTMRLQYVVEAATAATGVAMETALTIPNYLTIYRRTVPIVKGTAPQRIVETVEFYYDQNTIDNGIEVYLRPIGDNVSIYNISMFIRNW